MRRDLILGVSLILWGSWLLWPNGAWGHAKGLYKTQAEAEKRAMQLGCQGTHLNNGLWMPCANEETLHKELRQE
jgi:hypothetical protein